MERLLKYLKWIGIEFLALILCCIFEFNAGAGLCLLAIVGTIFFYFFEKLIEFCEALKEGRLFGAQEKKPFAQAGTFMVSSSTGVSPNSEARKSENVAPKDKIDIAMPTQSVSDAANESQQASQLDRSTDMNGTSSEENEVKEDSCIDNNEEELEDLEVAMSKIARVDGPIHRNFLGVRSMPRAKKITAPREKEVDKENAIVPSQSRKTKTDVTTVSPEKPKGKVSMYAIGVAGFRVTAPDYGLLLLYDVPTYTTKIRRRHKGVNTGFNIRLAKGLHWRIGGNQGVAENFEEDIALGTCTLLITNRYIFIRATDTGRTKRYLRSNVVGYEFYKDGISLNMQNGVPLTFVASSSEMHQIIDAALYEEET